MNEASEPNGPHPTKRSKRPLLAVACLILGSALAGYLLPHQAQRGFKKQPAQTPTRQEPSPRPNTSLEPELVCGYVVVRHTSAV